MSIISALTCYCGVDDETKGLKKWTATRHKSGFSPIKKKWSFDICVLRVCTFLQTFAAKLLHYERLTIVEFSISMVHRVRANHTFIALIDFDRRPDASLIERSDIRWGAALDVRPSSPERMFDTGRKKKHTHTYALSHAVESMLQKNDHDDIQGDSVVRVIKARCVFSQHWLYVYYNWFKKIMQYHIVKTIFNTNVIFQHGLYSENVSLIQRQGPESLSGPCEFKNQRTTNWKDYMLT